MYTNFRLKPSVILIATAFMMSTIPAHSAGFALIENSASGMGNAFAGAAAVAEDASTVWFNPAGMTHLGKSLGDETLVSQAGHIVSAKTEFTDRGSAAPSGTLSGTNAKKRVSSFVPNLYVVKPINEKLHFGLGFNGPFGSKTIYDNEWVGRYQATVTDLLTVNLNPSLSWKASEKLSIGGGLSAQYVNLKNLGSAIDSAGACRSIGLGVAAQTNSSAVLDNCNQLFPIAAQSGTDSHVTIRGENVAFGYNLGLLYHPSELTRIGVSYRSKVTHDVDGVARFEVNPGLAGVAAVTGINSFTNRDVKASITLPPSASVSVAHKVNDKLELLGDLTWTGWSTFDELLVTETDGTTPVTKIDESWEDVTRVSIGANYKYNDKLTLRTGLAFDEEPIPSADRRTPRIPGNDRTWVSVGAGYKVNKHMSLDIGYSHLFLNDTPINHLDENGFLVRGQYKSSVDIISAQVNMKF